MAADRYDVYFLAIPVPSRTAILKCVPFSLRCRQDTRWTEDKGRVSRGYFKVVNEVKLRC